MKILFADDDSKLHIIVKLWLQKNQMEMDSAYNGKEALEKLRAHAYDGLISDVNMPVVNGIDLVKEAIKLPDAPAIMVVLTSRSDVKHLEDDIEPGRVHFFNKPFSPAKLLELIRQLRTVVAEKI